MVELSVHDSGAGFRDDVVDRIFEPYVTSKSKGTGLGLAIAKKIVEEHGGTVVGPQRPRRRRADYRPPAGRQHLSRAGPARRHRHAGTGCLRRGTMQAPSPSSILVVDDEPGILSLVKDILEDEGYEVDAVQDAESARASRRNRRPDLILLDIWMPDSDGISLLREWSESSTGDVPPVIMMSGHGTMETAVEATRLGAYDFLEKPLSTAKLLLAIRRALEAAELRRENIGLKRGDVAGAGTHRAQHGHEQAPRPDQARRRTRYTGADHGGAGVAGRSWSRAISMPTVRAHPGRSSASASPASSEPPAGPSSSGPRTDR